MPPVRSLAVLLSLAALGACATAPAPPSADLRPRQAADAPAARADASTYGLYLAGQTALDQGQGDEASAFFAQAARQDDDTDSIKIHAFVAALVAGDIPRAASLAPGPNEGSSGEQRLGQLTRAVEALADGRGREAQTLLTTAPGGPTPDAASKILLPWAAAAAGDWKTALTLPDSDGDRLIQQVLLLDQALLYEHRDQIGQANDAFGKLLAQSDGAGLYTTAYGEFLQRHGRTATAINLYQAALKGNASNLLVQQALKSAQAGHAPPPAPTLAEGAGRALLAPAALLLAEKQPQLGLVYLRLVLRLDPKRDEAWLLVGDTLTAGGQTEAARDAYAHPQPGSPSYVAARERLIGSYDQPSDAPVELKLAQETVAAAPDDPDAMELLADALRVNERYAESAQVLDKLIAQQGPKAAWNLYYMRGVAFDQAGDWASAERDLKQALTLSPDEPEVLNYLGYSWIDRGVDLKGAKAMIERAVAAKPDSGAIVDSLGWAYYRLGQYPQAVEQLERATELEPADPDINDHLGDAYWRDGRRIEARFQWEQVLSMQPSDKLRAQVEAKLKSGLDTAPRLPVAEK
ncbi:MAG TPA: tetratricopeptide repeat protein [Caulobacteraceae bacterium]|jgi:tetratricopeptide (TPR) repeat protein|nr:tetratricopeptide repeat protein [Caulobacteraceae bacterium]